MKNSAHPSGRWVEPELRATSVLSLVLLLCAAYSRDEYLAGYMIIPPANKIDPSTQGSPCMLLLVLINHARWHFADICVESRESAFAA